MNLVDQGVLYFRRAAKPHELQVRTVTIYVAFLFVVFLLLFFLRTTFEQWGSPWNDFPVNLIDNLSAGVVTAAVAAFLLVVVSPRVSLEENLSVLDAWNINPALTAPLRATRLYYFRGRSGRWIRSQVLPVLAAAARRESSLRAVHLILPNPGDDQVLKTYADYRNSISRQNDEKWTPERIRNEIIATILKAGQLASGNVFFQVHISLLNDFSLFRIDLNDDNLILTREDPTAPGWISSNRSKFYATYLEDLRMAEQRGGTVNFATYSFPVAFTAGDVNDALQAVKLSVTLSIDDCALVLKAMSSTGNPYE